MLSIQWDFFGSKNSKKSICTSSERTMRSISWKLDLNLNWYHKTDQIESYINYIRPYFNNLDVISAIMSVTDVFISKKWNFIVLYQIGKDLYGVTCIM